MSNNVPPRESIGKSSVGDQLTSAIDKQDENRGPSEAGQHAKHIADLDKPDGNDDKKVLKLIGGVVAIVAAVALGTTLVKKKSKKEEPREEAAGFLDGAGKSLRSTGRWFGEKAESAKDKAGEVADDVAPRVKGAAGATKDKVSEAIPPSVSNTASNIKDRANITGLKAEREGLKASEKSDAAVRDAADKLLHKSSKAANKVDAKSGGFFSDIRDWLADRKDDAADATEDFAHKVEDTVKGHKK